MKLAWIVVNGPRNCGIRRWRGLRWLLTLTFPSALRALATAPWIAQRGAIQAQILERVRANLRRLDSMLAPGLPLSRLKVEVVGMRF